MLLRILFTLLFFIHYFLLLWINAKYEEYLIKTEYRPFGFFLDYMPFSCYKCRTTWTLVGSYMAVGFIMESLHYAALGIILSLMTGYALHYTEQERMEEGEREEDRDFFIE